MVCSEKILENIAGKAKIVGFRHFTQEFFPSTPCARIPCSYLFLVAHELRYKRMRDFELKLMLTKR